MALYLYQSIMFSKSLHHTHLLRKAAIVVLVLVYALGAVEFKGIHEAFHAEDHSEAQEKNPCHRSLYHQAKNACDHAFHFSQQKQCLLCHLVTHSDQWIAADAVSLSITAIAQEFISIDYLFSAAYFGCTDGRAPPVNA